jgi:hypothetical protein
MEKFYETKEWRELRYKILRKYPRKCMLCNAENKELHVDHIKPKSIYPELALDATNLQILCKECNLGKSNLYIDDFREKPTKPHDLSINTLRKKGKMPTKVQVLNKALEIYKLKSSKGKNFHFWNGENIICSQLKCDFSTLKEFDYLPKGKRLCNSCFHIFRKKYNIIKE